jgi:hypothetical protein
MKQTVEEAAKECRRTTAQSMGVYAQYHSIDECPNHGITYDEIAEAAFIKGAEWQAKQSPWISVKEQLPEYSCWVLVAGKDYKYRILFYCGGKFYTNKSLIAYDGSVLFWMFIPSFDQILEANKDVLQRLK